MKLRTLVALLSCVATDTFAQVPRTALSIAAGASGHSLSGTGDLAALKWTGPDGMLYGSTSDGLGIAWPGADHVVPPRPITVPQLIVANSCSTASTSSFVLWRHAPALVDTSDVYLAAKRCGPGEDCTWTHEGLVPKGYPEGMGDVKDLRLGCQEKEGGELHLYALLLVDPTPGFPAKDDEAWFCRSTDGGKSFEPAERLSNPGKHVGRIELAVDPGLLAISWTEENPLGWELWVAPSVLCGAELYAPSPPAVLGAHDGAGAPVPVGDYAIAVHDPHVLLSFERPCAPACSPFDALGVSVSQDRGATFSPAASIGGAAPGVHDVDDPHVAIAPLGDQLLVTWADDRFGPGSSAVFAARSTDAGGTWDETLLSPSGARPRLAVAAAPDDDAVAYWAAGAPGPADTLEARLSTNAGATWQPPVELESTPGLVAEPLAMHDPVYDNFLFAWRADVGGAETLYVGGFRPQTIRLSGWQVGSKKLVFDFEHFEPGLDVLALPLLALGPGALPLPDGRTSGLAFDPLFGASLQLAVGGASSAAIDATGAGRAVVLLASPIGPAAAGLSVHAIGLGFDPTTGELGSLTDVATATIAP